MCCDFRATGGFLKLPLHQHGTNHPIMTIHSLYFGERLLQWTVSCLTFVEKMSQITLPPWKVLQKINELSLVTNCSLKSKFPSSIYINLSEEACQNCEVPSCHGNEPGLSSLRGSASKDLVILIWQDISETTCPAVCLSYSSHLCTVFLKFHFSLIISAVDNLTPKFLNMDLNDSSKQQPQQKDGIAKSGKDLKS